MTDTYRSADEWNVDKQLVIELDCRNILVIGHKRKTFCLVILENKNYIRQKGRGRRKIRIINVISNVGQTL